MTNFSATEKASDQFNAMKANGAIPFRLTNFQIDYNLLKVLKMQAIKQDVPLYVLVDKLLKKSLGIKT